MVVRFLCPQGHRLIADPTFAGKKGQCPTCLLTVIVPVQQPRPSGRDKRAWDDGLSEAEEVAIGADQAAVGVGAATEPTFPTWDFGSPSTSIPHLPETPDSYWQNQPTTSHPTAQPLPLPQPVAQALPLSQVPQPAVARPLPNPTTAGQLATAQAIPLLPTPQSASQPVAQPVPQPVPQRATQAGVPSDAQLGFQFENIPELENPPAIPNFVVDEAPLTSSLASQAGQGKVFSVYGLGLVLMAAAFASLVPAFEHLNPMTAPGWARAVLLAVSIQMVYVLWMVALPDWSTVWVGMLLYAVLASGYAMMWMIRVFSASGRELILELHTLDQTQVAGWCATMVLAMGLLSYICGRFSATWRKEYERLKKQQVQENAPQTVPSS